jgi:hypothetical protein
MRSWLDPDKLLIEASTRPTLEEPLFANFTSAKG